MPDTHYQDDTISILDIIRFMRSLFGWLVISILLAGLCTAFFGAIKVLNHHDARIYSLGIDFTFPTAAEGKYQDGSVFSATQLIALPVLKRVVKDNQLNEEYDVDANQLLGMLSLSFDTDSAKNALQNYQSELARLKAAKAPYDTVAAFSEKFELQQQERGSGSRTVTLSDVTGNLPPKVAEKVVFDIPKIWSHLYTNQIGVSKSDLPMYQANLIKIDEIGAFDYPVIVDLIEDGLARLKDYKSEVEQIKGSHRVQDPETQFFLGDIDNQITRLERFELNETLSPLANSGFSNDPNATILLYEDEILQLGFENDKLLEIKSSLEQSIEKDHQREISRDSQRSYRTQSVKGTTLQLDSNFIDKIVDLSFDNKRQDFVSKLKARLLATEIDIADTTKLSKKVSARLTAIKQHNSFGASSGFSRSDAEMIISESMPKAIANLNTIWSAVHRIRLESDELANVARETLYSTHVDRVVPTKLNSLTSESNLIQLLACFIVVFFMLLMFGAVRQLLRNNPT